MKEQQDNLGISYDWDREITTSLPPIIIVGPSGCSSSFINVGWLTEKKASINWCPECLTVLANEQVEGGLCWRCAHEVEPRELEQWFLRITDYADRLLDDLDLLEDWPERVKIMQQNWIGRSEGTEIVFPPERVPRGGVGKSLHDPSGYALRGVTYMVLAPEHPLVNRLVEGTPGKLKYGPLLKI